MNSLALFDKATFEKVMTEVPKYKMITTSILCDRLRVSILAPFFQLLLVFEVAV